MSDLGPSGREGDGAARLLAASRRRVSAALADLGLEEPLRLSEWQRTTIGALLAGLVAATEDELRAGIAQRLPRSTDPSIHAALTAASVPIAAPMLRRASGFPGAPLVAFLLRRAAEHRFHRLGDRDSRLLVDLAADKDGGVAASAMAVLIAQSVRLDAFGEPTIGRSDLPAELEHRLVWTVAAALRRYLVETRQLAADTVDAAVAAAASDLLSGYDEGESLGGQAAALVRGLAASGRLSDDLVTGFLDAGNLPLFVAALAARAAIDADGVWELISDPEGLGPALVLRAAGIARANAAAALLRLAEGEAAAARLVERFDALDEPEARRRLTLWTLDGAYREALARFEASA